MELPGFEPQQTKTIFSQYGDIQLYQLSCEFCLLVYLYNYSLMSIMQEN